MLIIRLQRVGKKKFPTYRMIISEKTKDTQGDYLELLGNFNPHMKENQLNINVERVKYWLSKGAQMSDTVSNLLVANKVIETKKRKSVFLSKKRKAKLDEKNKSKAEAEAQKAAVAEAEAVKEVQNENSSGAEPAPASEEPVKEETADVQTDAQEEVKVEEKEEKSVENPA